MGRNMTAKRNDQDPELDPGTGLVKNPVNPNEICSSVHSIVGMLISWLL